MLTGKIASSSTVGARNVLAERFFTETQIEKVLPRLDKNFLESPNLLGEIIDTWNKVMGKNHIFERSMIESIDSVAPPATPPSKSPLNSKKIDMRTILADVEPGLLNIKPEMVWYRKDKIEKLELIKNQHDFWTILFNAPRGFFLQEWRELVKKIYYIDQKVIDYLYDKKELQAMITHPIIKAAAVCENNFDHIRTRYLFANRSGYMSLTHMLKVKAYNKKPGLREMMLSDNETYLRTFAPYSTFEEYSSFSNLMKNHDLDEDDAKIFEEMAKLNDLNCKKLK